MEKTKTEQLRELLEVCEQIGCGDSSCYFITPTGMATNGGCRCLHKISNGRSMNARLQILGPILRNFRNNAALLLEIVEAAEEVAQHSLYDYPVQDLAATLRKWNGGE